MTETILQQLAQPFHPSRIMWLPGSVTKDKTNPKAMAMAYADVRAYQNRLDEVCGMDWSVSYTPWADRIICHLTVSGVTRSSTGESGSDSERNEIAGTAAESQAFKRACAMFGLGRYLYQLPSTWVEYDAEHRRFTEQAKVRLNAIITQHYQRFLDGRGVANAVAGDGDATALDELGQALYGEQWPHVRIHNIKRLTGEETTVLSAEQIHTLLVGLRKLQQQRQAA